MSADKKMPNEYRRDGEKSYIYVAGCLAKGDDGIWRGSTFTDDELEHYEQASSTGFVISSNHIYRDGIDHAPDAVCVMAALGMIPDDLDRILCVDRRGGADAAPYFLDRFIEDGSRVVYDGNGNSPFSVLYGAETFKMHTTWSPDYSSEVRFCGDLSVLGKNAWKACHETYAAQQLLHLRELLENGQTVHCQVEEIPKDPSILAETVRNMSCRKVSAPSDIVNWPALGVSALAHREEEARRCFDDLGCGERILAVARFWDALLDRHPYRPRKAANVARHWGIDVMLDAYDNGVPLEYIVA